MNFSHRLSLNFYVIGIALFLGSIELNAQTASPGAIAPSGTDVPRPTNIKINMTHTEQPYFDIPTSADVLTGQEIRSGQRQVNLSESLVKVPGLRIQDRQNYAQDLQISSRGFGARAAFGIRGIRLFMDGVPATLPDGQGQVSHFSLGSAERIEVLRGPFSVLQGNASGGAIAMTTATPPVGFFVAPGFFVGSDKTWQIGNQPSWADATKSLLLDIRRFRTEGYREHSAAKRESTNMRASFSMTQNTNLIAHLNLINQDAQDPLGVKRATWEINPRLAEKNSPTDSLSTAQTFNTRKTLKQTQAGLSLEHQIDVHSQLRITGYGGQREIVQYLAIPVGTQISATNHPGAVVDLSRNYYGFDARYIRRGFSQDLPWTLSIGLVSDQLDEKRKGYRNFTRAAGATGTTCGQGTVVCGVQGDLRRSDDNQASNLDPYVEWAREWLPNWRSTLGLRYSQLKIDSRDSLSVGAPSTKLHFRTLTPALGLLHTLNEQVNTYVSWGKGWETPTLNELAYRLDQAPGLNTELRPATSSQLEWGVKAKSESLNLNVAVFTMDTRDEIVVVQNLGGRTIFQNANTTKRKGLEVGSLWRLSPEWSLNTAFTYLSAYYSESFKTCPAIPCSNPALVNSGRRLPGIPRINLYGDLIWQPKAVPGLSLGLESRWVDRVWVNDQNTDSARPYGLLNTRVEFSRKIGNWSWQAFARVDNIADIKYIGSVIVNDANGRFFESAPGRNYTLGLSLNYKRQ